MGAHTEIEPLHRLVGRLALVGGRLARLLGEARTDRGARARGRARRGVVDVGRAAHEVIGGERAAGGGEPSG